MRTETDENYLKEIYALEQDNNHVSTTMLADRLNCSPATVTNMLKKLAGLQWVVYEPYQGVNLTEVGREIALEVIRHHRLIETYLAQALQIPWDRVHGEAERLEHALSEYLEERIDELLGHPNFDPHGSPIPSREGFMPDSDRLRLADLPAGSTAEILEVNDHDPKLLVHLEGLGLKPKDKIKVIQVEPIDQLMTIQVSDKTHILGRTTTSQIVVHLLVLTRDEEDHE